MMRFAFWQGRSARERRILAVGGALALALLVVALLWLPLSRTRERLARELPALRASVATMERQAGEVRRLRSIPAAARSPAASVADLVSSGEIARGLPGAQLFVVDDRHLTLTGADVSFGALVEWLARAQAAHGLRVEAARIEGLPTAGRVRAELRLARS